MDKKKIQKLIIEEGLTLTDVIDVVVELNGIIGVGLISLGDGVLEYIYNKINRSRPLCSNGMVDENGNQEVID